MRGLGAAALFAGAMWVQTLDVAGSAAMGGVMAASGILVMFREIFGDD